MDEKRQIAMMRAFIGEDAREKAAEIEARAASQAEAQRQEEVKREKAKLEVSHKKDIAQVETEKRVRKAQQKKELDDQVLQKRVDCIDSIRDGARAKLGAFRSGGQYKDLIQQLTVQAAVVLEGDATVRCRPEDKGLINLAEASKQAGDLLKSRGRAAKAPGLTWDPVELTGEAAEKAVGGVFLSLKGDKKITCDNTLAARLDTCLEEFAPVVRHKLFGELSA
eukprot:Hpha_TRINITY_DN1666_c0_g1::TRINITY_DN1666_c0_g1_i1::g.48676::m.48676/K02150/ATPeV1E, ATP6E; V-type H+-transporting ATPase subunit E